MADEAKTNIERTARNGGDRITTMSSQAGKGSGRGWHGDPERHAQAGRKGGRVSGGNFANNRERASEAGRKGGQASAMARSHGATAGVVGREESSGPGGSTDGGE